MKHEELIYMIYKTHSGEWLSPSRVRVIASAITGTDILLTTAKRCITNLAKQNKLVRSKTASAWMAFEG